MRLSAKVEYSLKAVLALASVYQKNKPVCMSEIAEKQDISSKFLLQLMVRLKNAKIVASTRGASGGCYLLRSPESITVRDVVDAVDNTVTAGTLENGRSLPGQGRVIEMFWNNLNSCVDRCLEQTTVAELLEQYRKNDAFVYTI